MLLTPWSWLCRRKVTSLDVGIEGKGLPEQREGLAERGWILVGQGVALSSYLGSWGRTTASPGYCLRRIKIASSFIALERAVAWAARNFGPGGSGPSEVHVSLRLKRQRLLVGLHNCVGDLTRSVSTHGLFTQW